MKSQAVFVAIAAILAYTNAAPAVTSVETVTSRITLTETTIQTQTAIQPLTVIREVIVERPTTVTIPTTVFNTISATGSAFSSETAMPVHQESARDFGLGDVAKILQSGIQVKPNALIAPWLFDGSNKTDGDPCVPVRMSCDFTKVASNWWWKFNREWYDHYIGNFTAHGQMKGRVGYETLEDYMRINLSKCGAWQNPVKLTWFDKTDDQGMDGWIKGRMGLTDPTNGRGRKCLEHFIKGLYGTDPDLVCRNIVFTGRTDNGTNYIADD